MKIYHVLNIWKRLRKNKEKIPSCFHGKSQDEIEKILTDLYLTAENIMKVVEFIDSMESSLYLSYDDKSQIAINQLVRQAKNDALVISSAIK